MQILVCGMHRSGTSLVARLLNLMGVYFGPEGIGLPANVENPRGFWERRDVVALNDRLLASCGATWFDVMPFLARARAGDGDNPVVPAVAAKVLDLDASRPWFLKDPRLCLTLPFWRRWAHRAITVVCWRAPAAVAASLSRRSELVDINFSLDEAHALWEAYYVEALENSQAAPRLFVRYEDVLADPFGVCRRLHSNLVAAGAEHLRLPAVEDVAAYVESSLQRHGRDDRPQSEAVRELERRLAAADAGGAQLSAVACDVLEHLHQRVAARRHVALPCLSPASQQLIQMRVDAWTPAANGWTVARLRAAVDAATSQKSP